MTSDNIYFVTYPLEYRLGETDTAYVLLDNENKQLKFFDKNTKELNLVTLPDEVTASDDDNYSEFKIMPLRKNEYLINFGYSYSKGASVGFAYLFNEITYRNRDDYNPPYYKI